MTHRGLPALSLIVILITCGPMMALSPVVDAGGDFSHKGKIYIDIVYREGEPITGNVKAHYSLSSGRITDMGCTAVFYVTSELDPMNRTEAERVKCGGDETFRYDLGSLEAGNYRVTTVFTFDDGYSFVQEDWLTISPVPVEYRLFMVNRDRIVFEPLGERDEPFQVRIALAAGINETYLWRDLQGVNETQVLYLPDGDDYTAVQVEVTDANGIRNSENPRYRFDGTRVYPDHEFPLVRSAAPSPSRALSMVLWVLVALVAVIAVAGFVSYRRRMADMEVVE